jgi:hypothetical protein
MMEAVRTSETSVDNQFTRQYNPEDSSEHHTRRRETWNLTYKTFHSGRSYLDALFLINIFKDKINFHSSVSTVCVSVSTSNIR